MESGLTESINHIIPPLDFTVKSYRRLLEALISQGYSLVTFSDYLQAPQSRTIILRHDVDTWPINSLEFARVQHRLGVRGSYYFRIVPQSFDERIIQEIAEMGHEIGYHYETMDTCQGDAAKAIEEFKKNLEKFRSLVPIMTICMHGSPLSKWDNRDMWSGAGRRAKSLENMNNNPDDLENSKLKTQNSKLKTNYRDFGIIGEPYFDLDFSKVLYLTDTGRRWDGSSVSVRDKVSRSPLAVPRSPETLTNCDGKRQTANSEPVFHSTADIIAAANACLLPDQIMMTFHPQRWTDKPLPWLQELVMQNVKNVAKRILIGIGHRA